MLISLAPALKQRLLIALPVVLAASGVALAAMHVSSRAHHLRITSAPARSTRSLAARFAFRDSRRRMRFQCRLDKSRWRRCQRSVTYRMRPSSEVDFHVDHYDRHVFAVRSINRAGKISATASYRWTILATPVNLKVTGDATGPLYPGAPASPIAVKLTNPNPVPVVVTRLLVTIAGRSFPPGCSPEGFQINQSSLSGSIAVTLPARKSVGLPIAQATAPSIQMIDTGTDQDSCQGARLLLVFSAGAHS